MPKATTTLEERVLRQREKVRRIEARLRGSQERRAVAILDEYGVVGIDPDLLRAILKAGIAALSGTPLHEAAKGVVAGLVQHKP